MTGSTSTGTLNLDISNEDILIGPEENIGYIDYDTNIDNFHLSLFSGGTLYESYFTVPLPSTTDSSDIQIKENQIDIANAGIHLSHDEWSDFNEIVFNVPDTYDGLINLSIDLQLNGQQIIGLTGVDSIPTMPSNLEISYEDAPPDIASEGFKEMHIKAINDTIQNFIIYVTNPFTIKNVHIHYPLPTNKLNLVVFEKTLSSDNNTLTVKYKIDQTIEPWRIGGFQINLETINNVAITSISGSPENANYFQISDDSSTIIWSKVYVDNEDIQDREWNDSNIDYHFQIVYDTSFLIDNGTYDFVTTTFTSVAIEFTSGTDTYYTSLPTTATTNIDIARNRFIELNILNTEYSDNTFFEQILDIEGMNENGDVFSEETRSFANNMLTLEFGPTVSKIYFSDNSLNDGIIDFDNNEIKMVTNHILNNSEIMDIEKFDFNNDNKLDIADLMNLYNRSQNNNGQLLIYIDGSETPLNVLNLEDGENQYNIEFTKKGVLSDDVQYYDPNYVTGEPASTSDTSNVYDAGPAPAPDGNYVDLSDALASVDDTSGTGDGTTVDTHSGTGYQKFTDSSTGTDTYILGQETIDNFVNDFGTGQHIYISKVEVLNSTSECKLYFSIFNEAGTDGIGFQVMIPKLSDLGNDTIFLGGTNYIEVTNSSPPGLLGTDEYPLSVTDQGNPDQIISNFLWKSETDTTWLSSRELASMSFTYANVDTTLGSFEVDLFKIYPANNIYLHEVRINFTNKLIDEITSL